MKFSVKRMDAGGRIGIIKHNQKELTTPTLFPVVSPYPSENLIHPKEIFEEFGFNAIFTNAYLLFKKFELKEIAIEKGIHKFLNYNGLIATDSGAFQYYMYNMDEEISANEIERFQERIGSDFPVILDQPVQISDPYEIARKKIETTLKRALNNTKRRNNPNCAWFAPLHGGHYVDLLKYATQEMNKMDFGIYAVGGVVKSLNEYMFDYSLNAMLTIKKYLRPDRPLHLFGAGLPQYFALSIACGADTMDSAAYILFAKEGRYMTLEGTKYIMDLQELPCVCPICSKYTAKEIKEFFSIKKGKKEKQSLSKVVSNEKKEGIKLIAKHNLYISAQELKKIRESIREGTLWDLVEQRIHIHPRLLKAYFQLPRHWDYLEKVESVEKNKALFHFGNITYNRPIYYRIPFQLLKRFSIKTLSNLVLIAEYDSSLYNSPSLINMVHHFEQLNQKLFSNSSQSSDNLNASTNHTNTNNPNLKIPYEIMIVSNLFGLIPYRLVNIYPLTQRSWSEKYFRTNVELQSLQNYINPNNSSINYCENWEYNLYCNIIEKNNIPNNLEIDIGYDYIYNRIDLIAKFFEKNAKFIHKIILIKPQYFITEEGYKKKIPTHLIDDIEKILNSNNFSRFKIEKRDVL
ncbi:MAG: tRNA guanosine(15) transglycosylase TgtA [Candidatus Helarchaeota archaeon]